MFGKIILKLVPIDIGRGFSIRIKYIEINRISAVVLSKKLNSITDAIIGNQNVGDFRAGGVPYNGSNTDYTYYPNGSLKSDANKGISLIEYNTYLDKVKQVTWSDGLWLKLNYDGGGSLIKKENSAGEYWNYVGDLIYKNGNFYSINIPEGRAVFENNLWNYEFDYRDIWGNLRVSFSAENGQLTLKQKSDYDAFGYTFNQSSGVNKNFFQYQKQPRIEDFDLNVDFFKFRPSDPTIGRFWMVDPLSSQYPHNSVYALQENKFGMGVELEGKELQPFYPNLQGELYKSVGVNSSTNAQKTGYKLLKSYVAAVVTVMAAAAPVEELALGVIGLLAKEVGLAAKVELGVTKVASAEIKGEASAVKISEPYARPNNATTPSQRKSVQNQACVDCGKKSDKMVADHKKPLVKEYYETGGIDKTKMRSLDAVQPQCSDCSAKQGAELKKYSSEQKKKINE
jgi:hypothetical protein